MSGGHPPKGKGGARPGAGRKPSAVKLEHVTLFDAAWPLERRKAAVARVAAIAEGADGELALKAAEILFNRVYGKPTERKELSGPDAGPLPIAFEHGAALADLAAGSDGDPDAPGADEGDRDGA